MFLHLCFSEAQGFPRYEASLMGCSLIVILTLVAKYGKDVFLKKAKRLALGHYFRNSDPILSNNIKEMVSVLSLLI